MSEAGRQGVGRMPARHPPPPIFAPPLLLAYQDFCPPPQIFRPCVIPENDTLKSIYALRLDPCELRKLFFSGAPQNASHKARTTDTQREISLRILNFWARADI